ncbi:hypothetical protein SAMN05421767_12310 [Granulicatella balaenopterae]|uniref:Sugar-phosphatase n=1 Tax=Granulicatella balaenopterae TaxID=137733 RepID=A0A1H9M0W8_9LACT|nr:sugar-phosphatase [Granulicatella balaenopterae]SER17326.1 hypothetical protein SAMN05421767_12310 [Granulicatella balaenopterae]
MSIKLIAIDIDGTLLNSERMITPRVNEAIQKARQQGVYVVLCTGRPLPGVQDQLQELDLINDRDFVVTYNGSLVQRTGDGHTYCHFTLDYSDLEEVAKQAKHHPIHFHAIDQEVIHVTTEDIGEYSYHEHQLVNMPISHKPQEEIDPTSEFTKMMFVEKAELLEPFIAQLPTSFTEKYTLLRSAPYYLEVLNKDASKGKAVAKLAEILGLTSDEIMCLGDNENDMDMITYAGMGVAMGNAVESVKKVANFITATNDEDGVAVAIEKFVLS